MSDHNLWCGERVPNARPWVVAWVVASLRGAGSAGRLSSAYKRTNVRTEKSSETCHGPLRRLVVVC